MLRCQAGGYEPTCSIVLQNGVNRSVVGTVRGWIDRRELAAVSGLLGCNDDWETDFEGRDGLRA